MSATRRPILDANGIGPAFSQVARSASLEDGQGYDPGEAIAELVRQSAEANTALMRGDIDGYRALNPHTDDYVLMSPFGGTPTRGSQMTDERWEAVGRFFRNGTFEQEVVETYGSVDMAVLVIIERCRVEVGGLPSQDWPLRVTLVYRREGVEWRLAHRHADPLVNGVSLEQAAALARGEVP